MSKIKNGGLDQYGAGPFEQQRFGTAGVERVKQKKQRQAEAGQYRNCVDCNNRINSLTVTALVHDAYDQCRNGGK